MTVDNWTNIAVAFGTILLAILIVYGDIVQHYLVGPKLFIIVQDLLKEQISTSSQGYINFYSHLIIENKRPYSIAKNVEVLVTSIRIKTDPQIDYQYIYWLGPVPLIWQFSSWENSFNSGQISIGPKRICDFFQISKDKNILKLLIRIDTPMTSVYLTDKGSIEVIIELSAENFKSKPYCYEISWDGKWIDNMNDINSHLKVKEVSLKKK